MKGMHLKMDASIEWACIIFLQHKVICLFKCGKPLIAYFCRYLMIELAALVFFCLFICLYSVCVCMFICLVLAHSKYMLAFYLQQSKAVFTELLSPFPLDSRVVRASRFRLPLVLLKKGGLQEVGRRLQTFDCRWSFTSVQFAQGS